MKKLILPLMMLIPRLLWAEAYQEEIDKFFDLYANGKVAEAVDSVYSTNSYVSSNSDQILKLKNQFVSLGSLVGELHDFEKLDEYKVGDLFVHVTYIATYDRQPIRFEFQFFKNNEGWKIYAFSFDDNIDDEIEALARKKAIERSNG